MRQQTNHRAPSLQFLNRQRRRLLVGVVRNRSHQIRRIVAGVHVAELPGALVELSVEEGGVAGGGRRLVEKAVHLCHELRQRYPVF